jgi:predicted transcriptional regulator
MTRTTLTEQVRSNLTVQEREELERIAERQDRSVAAVIRRAIRDLIEREREEVAA